MVNKNIFDFESFKNELENILPIKEKISYCDTLVDELTSIIWKYKDDKIEETLINANLLEKYPRLKKEKQGNINKPKCKKSNSKSYINNTYSYDIHSEKYNRIILESGFREFKEYLWDILIPFINKTKIDFENDIEDEIIRGKIKRGELSESDKYPLFDFDIKQIKFYADRIFPNIEDKILYYSYVIKIYYQDDYRDKKWGDNYDSKIKKVEMELEYLKEIGKYKNNNITNKGKSHNGITVINNKNKIQNSVKLKWLGSFQQLNFLLQQLQKYDFIDDITDNDPSFKKYLSIFIDKENNSYSEQDSTIIRWNTSNSDFTYLIRELTLYPHKLLSNWHIWKIISILFVNQNHDKFIPESLSAQSAKNNVPDNKEKFDIILKQILNVS